MSKTFRANSDNNHFDGRRIDKFQKSRKFKKLHKKPKSIKEQDLDKPDLNEIDD